MPGDLILGEQSAEIKLYSNRCPVKSQPQLPAASLNRRAKDVLLQVQPKARQIRNDHLTLLDPIGRAINSRCRDLVPLDKSETLDSRCQMPGNEVAQMPSIVMRRRAYAPQASSCAPVRSQLLKP